MPMPLPEKNDFEIVPAGTHIATCYRVIDLGTQLVESKFGTKKQHKIMVSWELPNELMTEGDNAGKPFSIHKRYTYSSDDRSNLRKDLESWRGKPFTKEDFGKFDIFVLIGKGCMMGIVHQDKGDKVYSNITSIMNLPKGTSASPLVNAPVHFNIAEFDQGVYDALSDNIKATIAKSPEFSKLKGLDRTEPNTDEENYPPAEVPFEDTSIPF